MQIISFQQQSACGFNLCLSQLLLWPCHHRILCVQSIRASTGDEIEVASFVVPSSCFQLVLLYGEIELVSKAKAKAGSGLEIDAQDLSRHMQTRFSGQVVHLPFSINEGRLPAILVSLAQKTDFSSCRKFHMFSWKRKICAPKRTLLSECLRQLNGHLITNQRAKIWGKRWSLCALHFCVIDFSGTCVSLPNKDLLCKGVAPLTI